jgi:hypothetical protein
VVEHGPLLFVEVRLNGQGPFRMMVDTGTTSCSIMPRVVQQLGLAAQYRVHFVTPAGEKVLPGSRSVEVRLGSTVVKDVEFIWQDGSGFENARLDADGVIGQNLLSRFDYLLDYKHREIIIDSAEPHGGQPLKFTLVAGRMVVPASTDRPNLRLVLASAASNVFLWRSAGERVVGPMEDFIAMNGRKGVVVRSLPRLTVGDQTIERIEAGTVTVEDPEKQEDGLLPSSLFRSVFVSNSEQFVKLRR